MRQLAFVLLSFAMLGVLMTGLLWYSGQYPFAAPAAGSVAPAQKTTRFAAQTTTPAIPSRPSPIVFRDITDEMGIDFVPFSGTTSEKHFPTANGTGVAMIDFDQDGWLDLFFANGCRLDADTPASPTALCRSLSGERFERVSQPSGAEVTGYTQGVAVGDYNCDGFPDLYLTRVGPNILLENNGDGTFRDAAASSGLGDPRWSTSAAFLDYDEDGNPDLYVANYGQWDLTWHNRNICTEGQPSVRVYCSPKKLAPQIHRLYHSRGDGTFEDVAAQLGIARADGRGQGVVTCDVNNDGHIDIYVANDMNPNFLFISNGRGGFDDFTDSSGAAVNAEGNPEAGMGTDACDVDGDGLPELFVTNFYLEHNTLYHNLGNNLFQDTSHWSGVAAGSIHYVGWGTALEDFDGDGWPDILVANGHVDDNLHDAGRDQPYLQKAGVWWNSGRGLFDKMLAGMGDYFDTAHSSRGAAFGDLDNDGAVDVVITHKDERVTVLRNESRSRRADAPFAWIQFQLIGTHSNRDCVGASVQVHSDSRVISRQIKGGRSYVSGHDLRLTIGLGNVAEVDRVVIRWPNGAVQELTKPSLRQLHIVREPL